MALTKPTTTPINASTDNPFKKRPVAGIQYGVSTLQANFSPHSVHVADLEKSLLTDGGFFLVLSTVQSISTVTSSEQCGQFAS